jgi:hypothetical protein
MCPLRGLLHGLGSHITTEVYFDHDIVGVKIIVAFHRRFAPLRRAAAKAASWGVCYVRAHPFMSAGSPRPTPLPFCVSTLSGKTAELE